MVAWCTLRPALSFIVGKLLIELSSLSRVDMLSNDRSSWFVSEVGGSKDSKLSVAREESEVVRDGT